MEICLYLLLGSASFEALALFSSIEGQTTTHETLLEYPSKFKIRELGCSSRGGGGLVRVSGPST